jgi:hypothetical protein
MRPRGRSSGQGSHFPPTNRRHSHENRLSPYHRKWTSEWGQVTGVSTWTRILRGSGEASWTPTCIFMNSGSDLMLSLLLALGWGEPPGAF